MVSTKGDNTPGVPSPCFVWASCALRPLLGQIQSGSPAIPFWYGALPSILGLVPASSYQLAVTPLYSLNRLVGNVVSIGVRDEVG